ncbi:MAG TPA: Uma2 family endonuclease [Armatimonadota bacterium]|nr:Uma2 family endonuclease [Armatimonadota bacterium]
MTVETVSAIRYYYDEHPTEEDLVGENSLQDCLNKYLVEVVEQLFHPSKRYVARNLNIYVTQHPREQPLAPDVALFKGISLTLKQRAKIKSWPITEPGHPPPDVVFEIASDKTADIDILEKPARYARMGVKEYYAYDPREECGEEMRLRGWKNRNGQAYEVKKDERGWIWSEELESWLVPAGLMLRLYDADLNLRLTGEEAEREAKERALASREQALADAEAERAAKEKALADADAEGAAKAKALADADAERAAKERAWAKLREHGIDPESL